MIESKYNEIRFHSKHDNRRNDSLRSMITFEDRNVGLQRGNEYVLAHSSFAPLAEARHWASQWAKREGTLVVYGAGSGYHLQALADICPKLKVVCVDPHVPTLPAAPCLVTGNWTDFKTAWLAVLNRWKPIAVTAWPPYARLFQDDYTAFLKRLVREVQSVISDRCTALRFSYDWQKNVLKNLRFISESAPVCRTFGKCEGMPIIVVASGPSLDGNIKQLAAAQNKAFIIALGSALRPLLKAGIKPSCALAFDGGNYNFINHFQGLQCDVPLVYDLILHHKVLEEYTGPKVLMTIWPCNEFVKHYIESEIGYVQIGPSIANTAFDYCLKLKGAPIIFVGLDLAYTGRKTHASNTHADGTVDARHAYALDRTDATEIMNVIGQDGTPIPSNSSMITFLHWFEERLSQIPNCPLVINATEGGANVRGMSNRKLADVLAEFCTVDRSETLADIYKDMSEPPKYNIPKLTSYLSATKLHIDSLLFKLAYAAPDLLADLPRVENATISFGVHPVWEELQCGVPNDKLYPLATSEFNFILPLIDETVKCLQKCA